MPSLNINDVFKRPRKCTQPVVNLPRNLREAFCIDEARENGTFRLEPERGGACLYDKCYLFEDINYANLDQDKKKNTLVELVSLFRTMDGQFKITVASEKQDMDSFMRDVFRPLHGKEYPVIEEGLREWVNQKVNEGTRDIRKTMYFTVTCSADSFGEADSYFATLDTVLSNAFRSLGSRLYRLNAEERLLVLQHILRDGEGIPPTADMLKDDGWKAQVMPTSIEQETDYMLVDNKRYMSVLYAHDFGQTLNEEKVLHSLSDVPFPAVVTVDMSKIPKAVVRDRILSAHANNEKLISQENDSRIKKKQYGLGTSYNLSTKKNEIEEILDQVDSNDEEGLFVGLLAVTWADSLEELTRRVDLLKYRAENYTLDTCNHRQLKALNTVLPIGGRQISHMRFFYTSSAAAFQPFHSADLNDGSPYVHGINQVTKHLIRADRKKLPAGHGFIIGHTGTGKSFLIKEVDISPTLLFSDDDVIVLDPNNEQQAFISNLEGGQYFDLMPQSGTYMNPFEVPEYVENGDGITRNRFVAKMTEYAVSFCTAIMTNILVTQVHSNIIGRSVREMYSQYFNPEKGKRGAYPTLSLFREILKQKAPDAEFAEQRRLVLDIVDSLEEYTDGMYDMFAHESNIDMSSRLVGFGLKNVPQSIWEAAMLTIMSFLTMRIEFNQAEKVALHLIVDEAQVMCESESTAGQLLSAVETYRKMGAIVTLAAQNLTHILEHPRMRDMFSNCPYKVILDQGGIDAANLSRILSLSSAEYRVLEEGRKGQGLLVWANDVFVFDCVMDKGNPLYDYFNTDFHEQAAKQKSKALSGITAGDDESARTEASYDESVKPEASYDKSVLTEASDAEISLPPGQTMWMRKK